MILEDEVETALGDGPEITIKSMFGCVCWMHNGNMAVGVKKDELLVRLGPKETPLWLRKSHVRAMTEGGRTMAGWVWVRVKDQAELQTLCAAALDFVQALPAKTSAKRSR